MLSLLGVLSCHRCSIGNVNRRLLANTRASARVRTYQIHCIQTQRHACVHTRHAPSSAAFIYLPYTYGGSTFFEMYYMNVPIFVPTLELLVTWHLKVCVSTLLLQMFPSGT